MAQIDASIPLGIKPPQFESPLNQLAKVLQVQDSQQSQQMNRLKMDEYSRGVEEKNRLQSLFQAGTDANGLRRAGFHSQALDWEEKQGKMKREEAAGAKDTVEVEHKTIGIYRDASQAINDPASAVAFVTTMHSDPRLQNSAIARVPLDQLLAKIPQDPAALQAWKQEFALGAQKFMEMNKPQYITSDTGGQTVTTAVEGLTGKVRPVQALQNTQSPNNAASVGAQYAIAQSNRDAATINAKGVRDAAAIKDARDTEMKLSDDYRAQSKPFKEVADAYRTIETSLKSATTSPAATLAGATKFMKLLDPGSVVRESELGMALAASGVFDRAANYINVLQKGKVLTAQQAADFQNIAGQIYTAAQQQQQTIDADYRKKAETYKLRPDMVLQDLGQNSTRPVDLNSLPSGGKGGGASRVVNFGDLK